MENEFLGKNRRLRVLLTTPHLNPLQSPYRETIALAKYLPKDTIDLTVCSLTPPTPAAEEALRTIDAAWLVAPFRPTGRTLRHVVSSLYQQDLIEKLGPFDIQHSLDYTTWPYEAVIARVRRRQFISHQRNLNEGGNAVFLRLKLQLANRIIAISPAVEQFIFELGIPMSKCRTILNGIDVDEIAFGVNDHRQQPCVLSVGHLERRKRVEDAILATDELRREFPNLQLRIVGRIHDRKYYEELKALVAELELQQHVEFLGPQNDILELMRSSKALVHCAESEAFGWVLVEAMSVGLPVVAGKTGGPAEIIHHGTTGLLGTVGNYKECAMNLRKILSEPEYTRHIAENARATVERRFSAQTMASQVFEVYREVLNH